MQALGRTAGFPGKWPGQPGRVQRESIFTLKRGLGLSGWGWFNLPPAQGQNQQELKSWAWVGGVFKLAAFMSKDICNSTYTLSHSTQAAITKYYTLGGLNHMHLFLTVINFEMFKIRVWAWAGSWPSSGLADRATFSLCLHIANRTLVSSSSYYTDLTMGIHPYGLIQT